MTTTLDQFMNSSIISNSCPVNTVPVGPDGHPVLARLRDEGAGDSVCERPVKVRRFQE